MTPEEKNRLREIVAFKWNKLQDPEAWSLLLDDLGVRRMDKFRHLCAPPELDEVRVEEPGGGYLCMKRDTARKILVLGL